MYPHKAHTSDEQWCKDFAKYTFTQAEGSAQDKEDLEYQLDASDYAAMPPLEMKNDGYALALGLSDELAEVSES